jgi:hypothetical protein
MSIYEDVQAAAAEVGSSAIAAAQRVLDAVAAAAAIAQGQIAEANAALQAEIDAGAANAASLTSVVDTLTAADATIDGIAVEAAPPIV